MPSDMKHLDIAVSRERPLKVVPRRLHEVADRAHQFQCLVMDVEGLTLSKHPLEVERLKVALDTLRSLLMELLVMIVHRFKDPKERDLAEEEVTERLIMWVRETMTKRNLGLRERVHQVAVEPWVHALRYKEHEWREIAADVRAKGHQPRSQLAPAYDSSPEAPRRPAKAPRMASDGDSWSLVGRGWWERPFPFFIQLQEAIQTALESYDAHTTSKFCWACQSAWDPLDKHHCARVGIAVGDFLERAELSQSARDALMVQFTEEWGASPSELTASWTQEQASDTGRKQRAIITRNALAFFTNPSRPLSTASYRRDGPSRDGIRGPGKSERTGKGQRR